LRYQQNRTSTKNIRH